MFGDNGPSYMPTPPALPPEPPAAPQFASQAARPVPKGKPYGGTLLTAPMGPGPQAQAPVARKSLLGL